MVKPENDLRDRNEERSATIHRLQEEIGRVIEREYALLGKYREFAASFEAVIPDEKLRHDAALQALSTTMKLSRQELAEAFNQQQEELAILEKAVGELFADIKAKTTVIKQSMDGLNSNSIPCAEQGGSEQKNGIPWSFASQRTASHKDCPMCGERMTFDNKENKWKCYSCAYEELPGETAGAEQDPGSPPALTETQWRKKCPMCGGQMNFHVQDEQWLCYTCAHEEVPADDVQGKSEGKRDQTKTPGAPATSFALPLAAMINDESRNTKKGASLSPGQPAGGKKICSVCRKKMDWHELEKQWRCFYCGHKTRY